MSTRRPTHTKRAARAYIADHPGTSYLAAVKALTDDPALAARYDLRAAVPAEAPAEPMPMVTIIPITYADASNYKQHEDLVLAGVFTDAHRDLLARALDDGEYFIPGQVGLDHLGQRFTTGFPTDDDRVWHTLGVEEIEVRPETAEDAALVSGTVEEFVARFAPVAQNPGGHGWDVEFWAAEYEIEPGEHFGDPYVTVRIFEDPVTGQPYRTDGGTVHTCARCGNHYLTNEALDAHECEGPWCEVTDCDLPAEPCVCGVAHCGDHPHIDDHRGACIIEPGMSDEAAADCTMHGHEHD